MQGVAFETMEMEIEANKAAGHRREVESRGMYNASEHETREPPYRLCSGRLKRPPCP